MHLQPDHLPEPVRARCWALMQQLGLHEQTPGLHAHTNIRVNAEIARVCA